MWNRKENARIAYTHMNRFMREQNEACRLVGASPLVGRKSCTITNACCSGPDRTLLWYTPCTLPAQQSWARSGQSDLMLSVCLD
jgi:hypothetical protein